MLPVSRKDGRMRMIMLSLMVLSLAIVAGTARAADTELVPLEELKTPGTAEEMSYFAKRCSALSRTLFEVNKRKKGKSADAALQRNLGRMAHSYSIMAFNLAYTNGQNEETQKLVDYKSINAEITKTALLYLDVMKKEQAAKGNGVAGLATRDAKNCAKTYQALVKAKDKEKAE